MAYNYITKIEKTEDGFLYTLKSPVPSGGYCVFLNGVLLARGLNGTEYNHKTIEKRPPPIEVSNAGGNFYNAEGVKDKTPSLVAGDSVILRWRHVYGVTHYQIQVSVDGGDSLVCCVMPHSGETWCEYRIEDIVRDCEIEYKVFPGVLVGEEFTATADSVLNFSQRAFIPKPPEADIVRYDPVTKKAYLDLRESIL